MVTWSSWTDRPKEVFLVTSIQYLSREPCKQMIATLFLILAGEFKVRLPDGRLQVTSYQADERGFRPKISYEIDPLFVPPPPQIGFTPEKKLVRRPPPKDYSAPEYNYLPPTINYDPRGQHHKPAHDILTPVSPSPSQSYLPPQKSAIPARPPSQSYSVPNYGYTPQYDDLEPLINYLPRKPTPSHAPAGNYLSPDLFAPIERKDDDEEVNNND